jgi:hypothetical protein
MCLLTTHVPKTPACLVVAEVHEAPGQAAAAQLHHKGTGWWVDGLGGLKGHPWRWHLLGSAPASAARLRNCLPGAPADLRNDDDEMLRGVDWGQVAQCVDLTTEAAGILRAGAAHCDAQQMSQHIWWAFTVPEHARN